jgi:predicted phosphodiesterase
MKPLLLSLITSLFALLLIAAAPDDKPKGGAGQGGQVEPAVVPPYLFNVWLCRPGAESVTVSVLAWEPMEAFISYGESNRGIPAPSDGPGMSRLHTAAVKLDPGVPQNVVMSGLKPDTSYNYRLTIAAPVVRPCRMPMRSFHTQRKAGSTFSFVMQADSHLDNNTDVRVYQQTLANMLADKPDFMIDLGDTTMVDKFGRFYTRSESQYKAQRYYMGRIAHSVPIFMVLGNHDGERGSDPEMSDWSLKQRHTYFPNPTDGNDKHSYFAFEWGNALFIGLDPFWATTKRGASGWEMTLGEAQYRWLTKRSPAAKQRCVLSSSITWSAAWAVMCAAEPNQPPTWNGAAKTPTAARASKSIAPAGSCRFINSSSNMASALVFHGHDHLFVKEELDGIIYQEVPQPGHPSGGTRSAEEYGYTGVILGSSGHVRVMVGENEARVDYMRSIVPGVTRSDLNNGAVEHSYAIKARRP